MAWWTLSDIKNWKELHGSKLNNNVSLSSLQQPIKILMDKWSVSSWFVIELKHCVYIVFVSFQDVLLVSTAVIVPIDACVVMEENVIMWQEDVHARLAGLDGPVNTVSFWQIGGNNWKAPNGSITCEDLARCSEFGFLDKSFSLRPKQKHIHFMDTSFWKFSNNCNFWNKI